MTIVVRWMILLVVLTATDDTGPAKHVEKSRAEVISPIAKVISHALHMAKFT